MVVVVGEEEGGGRREEGVRKFLHFFKPGNIFPRFQVNGRRRPPIGWCPWGGVASRRLSSSHFLVCVGYAPKCHVHYFRSSSLALTEGSYGPYRPYRPYGPYGPYALGIPPQIAAHPPVH